MSNAIASVAHRITRRLGVVNMRGIRAFARGHRIEAARMKWVAAPDAQDPKPQPAQHAVHPHGFERVLRAARVVAAAGPEQRAQAPLVYTDQELDSLCAHASLICFHSCCKAARSAAAGASRAADRAR